MYVADGYGNARVHKYSAAGDYLFSWGEPGQGPGQFNLVHPLAMHPRVMVFDSDGTYRSEWTGGVHRPNGFRV